MGQLSITSRKLVSDVVSILDSHIEATKGWLEPLLDRIARDKTNVVWPVIDIISDKTLMYKNDPDAGSQVSELSSPNSSASVNHVFLVVKTVNSDNNGFFSGRWV